MKDNSRRFWTAFIGTVPKFRMNHWENLDAAKLDTAQSAEMKKAPKNCRFVRRIHQRLASPRSPAHEPQPLCQPTEIAHRRWYILHFTLYALLLLFRIFAKA
jgi:hypothetical protein